MKKLIAIALGVLILSTAALAVVQHWEGTGDGTCQGYSVFGTWEGYLYFPPLDPGERHEFDGWLLDDTDNEMYGQAATNGSVETVLHNGSYWNTNGETFTLAGTWAAAFQVNYPWGKMSGEWEDTLGLNCEGGLDGKQVEE